ncbi:MAG: PEGA domain-containing protein, partial [Candidatus Cloacimonadales bacterium]|nr:PEGA domain-containing protein [Candidatus Cloacimonadales bacterium]
MKKFLLIVLIVAVIGVGALFIFKGKAVVRRSKHLLSEFKEATIRKVDITFELTESGVSIALDNEAPVLKSEKITLFTLEKGMHHFSFSKEGYEKLEKEIDAVENATISISLTKIKIIETVKHIPQPGYIKINSNPEGAAILINNKQKAVTPATIKLDAGKYTVKVQMKNYHEFSLKFSLKEAETKTFDTIELLPKFAYYSVDIAPAKAKIYLDNFLVGNTRIEKTTLSSGKHNLVIKADQYYDFKQDFKVKDGEYKQFDVKLKATFGSLAVNSEPEEGANVYIDEQIAGQTPYLDEHVLPGQYRVRVEKKLCIGTEKILTVFEYERTSETLVMT